MTIRFESNHAVTFESFKRFSLSLFLCLMLLVLPPNFMAQEEKEAEKAAVEKAKQDEAKKAETDKPKSDETKKPDEPKKPADPMSSGTFSGLRMRLLGPAFTSGRVVGVAVDPKKPSTYYVAAASGGVWKTINSGTTWTPVFDSEGSYSIGVVVVDPKNPLTVWVGTGENNSQRSVSYGNGVYKSEDGGKSWKNMGLKTSEHIGRIAFDPRDSNTLYVAAQGPLWSAGGERGLYKTTDGGKTWNQILKISENTGVTDVVIDPNNPDTLYAAAYQRRRHVFTMINGGPESAMYKSTDAGATWNKISRGLPSNDLGRIGLAISPVDTNVLYATIEASDGKGGVFRSIDRGGSWERRNEFDAVAMYYSQIYADPKDLDRVYVMNTFAMVSDDGGKTLTRLGERSKHSDNHFLWIDPEDTSHYLLGSDGGLYESRDRAATWDFKENLPLTQFYDVTTDNALPFYNVYGGTQDNFSIGGPSRTRSASGITNADWFVTQGGDGFRSQVDPTDPNTIYAEYQHGGLARFDKRTGERVGIQPATGRGEDPLRLNWDVPFIISPHQNTRLYFAANKLYRSDDRGDSWTIVSGELSRALNRDKLPVFGKVQSVDAVARHASTAFYGNASALAESAKKEGLIYVGSDDGLIQVTEDGGKNWRKIDKFTGIPGDAYVSRLVTSNYDANTVYASFDNHWNGDFTPYLMKSTDAGRNWVSLKGDLPTNGPVLAIAEDHVNPNLLFAGTEFGVFFSPNGGQKWVQLKGNFPTIAVHDLAIQKRENDLVIGTFGRGVYVLDNYAPLRMISAEMLKSESVLFPVKDALMYIQSQPLGGRGKGFQGETFYTADNPAFGATFTYYLKDAIKTRKARRQESEKEARTRNTEVSLPSNEDLRAEDEEEAPVIIVTVTDQENRVVRRLTGSISSGIQRVNWDLRSPSPTLSGRGGGGSAGATDAEADPSFEAPSGPLVMPGAYKVSIAKRVGGVLTQLSAPQTFNIFAEGQSSLSAADRTTLLEFQQKVGRLQRAVAGALEASNSLKPRLVAIRRALLDTPSAGDKLLDDASRIDLRVNEILRSLRGDTAQQARNQNLPPSINDRVSQIVGDQRMAIARPTGTHAAQYAVAAQEFEQVLGQLRTLIEVDLKNLEKAMEAAGAPHTPGRIPEWKEQ